MKLLLTTVVVAIVIIGVLMVIPSKTEVIQHEAEVLVEEVEVDALEKSINDAQDAKKAEMEAIANKAWQEAYDQEMKKVELEVIKSFNDKLDTRQIELEKETKTYWKSKSNVVNLIREAFPEDADRAVAVANCESRLNPSAVNKSNANGTVDGGLWQINSVHDKKLKELGLDKFDPEDATKFARMLYEERGFQDWVCHTKGLAYSS